MTERGLHGALNIMEWRILYKEIGGHDPCANHLRMTSIAIYLSLSELTTNVEILVVSSLDVCREITLHHINSNPGFTNTYIVLIML